MTPYKIRSQMDQKHWRLQSRCHYCSEFTGGSGLMSCSDGSIRQWLAIHSNHSSRDWKGGLFEHTSHAVGTGRGPPVERSPPLSDANRAPWYDEPICPSWFPSSGIGDVKDIETRTWACGGWRCAASIVASIWTIFGLGRARRNRWHVGRPLGDYEVGGYKVGMEHSCSNEANPASPWSHETPTQLAGPDPRRGHQKYFPSQVLPWALNRLCSHIPAVPAGVSSSPMSFPPTSLRIFSRFDPRPMFLDLPRPHYNGAVPRPLKYLFHALPPRGIKHAMVRPPKRLWEWHRPLGPWYLVFYYARAALQGENPILPVSHSGFRLEVPYPAQIRQTAVRQVE